MVSYNMNGQLRGTGYVRSLRLGHEGWLVRVVQEVDSVSWAAKESLHGWVSGGTCLKWMREWKEWVGEEGYGAGALSAGPNS